jgi:hypothetical protein
LGITHFVDDRLDVLGHLATVAHRYLFTGGLGDGRPPAEVPPWATVANTWSELVDQIQWSTRPFEDPRPTRWPDPTSGVEGR